MLIATKLLCTVYLASRSINNIIIKLPYKFPLKSLCQLLLGGRLNLQPNSSFFITNQNNTVLTKHMRATVSLLAWLTWISTLQVYHHTRPQDFELLLGLN